jgi:predicted GNAT family acetyltransferase
MLVVASGWRGRGVGRALVEQAIDLLREAGCGLCEVTSNRALIEAHAFYEKPGFGRPACAWRARSKSPVPNAQPAVAVDSCTCASEAAAPAKDEEKRTVSARSRLLSLVAGALAIILIFWLLAVQLEEFAFW